jgi:glucose/arabinose dehydrogenase
MSTRTGRRAGPSLLPCVSVVLLVAAACGNGATSGSAGPAPTPVTTRPSAGAAGSGDASPTRSAAASTATGASSASTSFDPAGLKITFTDVVGGLQAPLAIVNAGDGSKRILVVEQGGQVRIVRGTTLVDRPFLDVADRISSGGERGLLGLAFHPAFPDDPRIFVDYTDVNGDTRVSSFRVDPARPDVVDPSTEQRLLFVKQPYPNHNGGALAFGPDGDLYISLGDGGSGGDPQGNGQSTKTLLAKILRIDVDHPSGERPYAIPADNPFADGAGGLPEIWLTGLRNPWRMSFDDATGDLWIGDVGQGSWEEVDVQRANAPGGTNFGWNRMEGSHCYQPSSSCANASLTTPVTDYGHDQGCTVIGGLVVRGTRQSSLTGGYLFADYCSGRVWAIDPTSSEYRKPTLVAETAHNFAAFGEDEDGEPFAVDISAGTLMRVTATVG